MFQENSSEKMLVVSYPNMNNSSVEDAMCNFFGCYELWHPAWTVSVLTLEILLDFIMPIKLLKLNSTPDSIRNGLFSN